MILINNLKSYTKYYCSGTPSPSTFIMMQKCKNFLRKLSTTVLPTISVDSLVGSCIDSFAEDKSKALIELEGQHSAHNYNPIPVVLSRGSGVYVWDVNDKVGIFYLLYRTID